MHEHLTVGYPGFEAHTSRPGPNRADMVTVCVERIRQLQELGYSSMLDPCPSDLGRDVELMVEVAEATGFNIICATGIAGLSGWCGSRLFVERSAAAPTLRPLYRSR